MPDQNSQTKSDGRPLLLRESDSSSHLGGPIFEPRPGWGFYITRWLKKYFLKVILPAVIVVIAVGILTAHRSTENGERVKETATKEKITQTIARGDSRALLARKALASYLKDHPEELLSGGQKIFIEERLRQKLNNQKLTVGKSIEFSIEDIKAAISQARQLTQFQLEAWEEYAKKAKLD